MSERKTAEIKFRVEPSAKARWQALADTQGKPLSEVIRDRMDFAVGVAEVRVAADVAPLELPTSRVSGFAEFIKTSEGSGELTRGRLEEHLRLTAPEPTDFYGGPDFDAPGVADIAVPVATALDPLNVEWCNCTACYRPIGECRQCVAPEAPSADEGAKCACRAWEFCSHKAFEDSVTR